MSKWVEIKLIREGKTPTLAVRCPRCLYVPLWLGSPILPTNSGNLDYCPHCGMNMKGVDSEDLIKRSDALEVVYRYCPDDDGSCSYADRDLQEMLDDIEDIPSADRPSEIIYGNEHNCIMTIFGECSYAKTGCGDCAVVEKVRKALSADRPQGKWFINDAGDAQCPICGEVESAFIYGLGEYWYGRGESHFCPNCGAHMKGADDEM